MLCNNILNQINGHLWSTGRVHYVLALLLFGGDFLTDKPFKTIKQQLEILEKERHLTILDPELADRVLRRYGYYEIINGYKTPFLIEPGNDEKGYKTDATFEHIYALYTLDRQIRETILQGIEQFEQTFKQTLAYVIAEEISDDETRYTAKSHYNKGESHHYHGQTSTDRDRMLKRFNKLLQSPNQPFSHYATAHHNIPPWIMIKGLTFGESIYWFKLSKKTIREKIVAKMFGFDPAVLDQIDSILKIKQAFGDILSLCLDYRNLTAHGGRIYNHRSSKFALKWSPFIYRKNVIDISHKQFSHKKMRSSIGALIKVLHLFENRDPHSTITIWLSIRFESHLKKYPMDKEMLEESTELNFNEDLP